MQVIIRTVFLKNTQDTDPSWVLLKCQEQAHVKGGREGMLVMQAMSLQGGADPMSMTLHLLLARTCIGPTSMLSPGRALPPGL